MSLDAEDRARLRRIEAELEATDPALARRFRRFRWWQPSRGLEPIAPGWSVAPPWVLVVFLVGLTTWTVAPAVGAMIAVVACCRAARSRARHGAGRPVDPPGGRNGRRRQGTS